MDNLMDNHPNVFGANLTYRDSVRMPKHDPNHVKIMVFHNRTISVLDGISGTSSAFVALIIVSATFPSLLRNMMAVLYPNSVLFSGRKFWTTLIVDFAVTILPVELMITLLNEQSPYFFTITCLAIAAMFTSTLCRRHIRSAITDSPFLTLKMPERSPFIHYFRAYTNIFTSFSILAVDFNIYPTYFMKSRVYGTALMDSGLGFYVISNAIVSPEARGIVSYDSLRNSMMKATKDTIPLLFFGFARFYVLGMADYHVPVQEYGVHWNFFFTLAVVKMTSTLLFGVTPLSYRKFLGPGIILVYQCLLTKTELQNFILFGFSGTASRDGVIEANREGIVASIGFIAIYFIGVQVGAVLMKKRETTREYLFALAQITGVCCGSWIMMNITSIVVQMPSRKFANLAYTFFVIGVTTLLMVQGLVFDVLINYFRHLTVMSLPAEEAEVEMKKDKTCPLLNAINYNGLFFFAVANLMTGIINMCIDTKQYSNIAAFCIVSTYMFTLSFIFLKLYRRKFVFKSVIWRKETNGICLPK